MTKNSFTIFGQGFVGTNISIFLKKKKYKLFFPKKGQYKFKKNLHNVIYCIGNQNWLKDPKITFDANLGLVPEIIFNNRFDSFTLISTTRLYFANPEGKTSENDPIKINSNNKNFLYNSLKIAAENLCLSINNKNIKVVPGPCMGRCDVAPTVCVGKNYVDNASAPKVEKVIQENRFEAVVPNYISLDEYKKNGGYKIS